MTSRTRDILIGTASTIAMAWIVAGSLWHTLS